MIAPPPPLLEHLPAGTRLRAGMGFSTVLPDLDFETYSEAGYVWHEDLRKWKGLAGAPQGKKGLPVVGAAVYAKHPSTEVLSLSYDLKDGRGKRRWRPDMPPPVDLFLHVRNGGLLEAWNSGFEYWIWNEVCTRRYAWPPIPLLQLRDAMAKARAFSLPGSLANAGEVLQITKQKDAEGTRLLKKFSMPRDPTKADPSLRHLPAEYPQDAEALYLYNDRDIEAEAEASSLIPDQDPVELQFWLADQAINRRGVAIDGASILNAITIVEQAHTQYNAELFAITGGTVKAASELQKLIGWLGGRGVHTASLDEENLDGLLKTVLPHPPNGINPVRRALEIRSLIGSAAVKKLYAMKCRATPEWRLHDLFNYYGARTGRATGEGPQPTNLPNSGPHVYRCACGNFFGTHRTECPFCLAAAKTMRVADTYERLSKEVGLSDEEMVDAGYLTSHKVEWSSEAAECAIRVIESRSLQSVEYVFGEAMPVVAGCLRGMFIAARNCDLICSDYTAIEAVVLAELAGEAWRCELFKNGGKIYEASGAKVAGLKYEDVVAHKKTTGNHHPVRKKGKVMELALGYQGWIGAMVAFGAAEWMTEDEMKQAILGWREASPMIVEFWGGQSRRSPWRQEYFGIEGAAIQAVLYPGREFEYRGFAYVQQGDALYCRLLSGRYLTYHSPRLVASDRRKGEWSLSYEGYNSNPKNGATGWLRMDTWGGRLVENIVQAVARDLLAHAIVNLERVGYRVVLHVYDEIVAEVPEGFGSVAELERIMATPPHWAASWPVSAAGGWRGKRYRK